MCISKKCQVLVLKSGNINKYLPYKPNILSDQLMPAHKPEDHFEEFPQDGVPPHYARVEKDYLEDISKSVSANVAMWNGSTLTRFELPRLLFLGYAKGTVLFSINLRNKSLTMHHRFAQWRCYRQTLSLLQFHAHTLGKGQVFWRGAYSLDVFFRATDGVNNMLLKM